MKTLFSILFWVYWSACLILFCGIIAVLYLITLPFDRFNRIPNKAIKWLGWLMLKVNPGWTIQTRGLNKDKVSAPTLVVANHQSFLDMPLTHVLPWNMKWVSKKSLFYIPVLGWIIYMTGHLGINRRSLKSVQKLDRLVEPIEKGIPGMIFPEGTRTNNGELQPFKKGAFVLADRYNFNVLPVVLEGGYNAMPMGTWKIKFKQQFTVSVLDPIQPQKFQSAKELKNYVFKQMERELKKIRNEKSS